MFEQVFKNIDDIIWKDSGCGSELDYIEQISWILFLKYLNDFEKNRKTVAGLEGSIYKPVIDEEFCWDVWAAPRTEGGEIDRNKTLNGDDLREFVNERLFPYLKGFKLKAMASDTIEYKIGEIFSELKNKLQSGYKLREVINEIDALSFRSHREKHKISHLYEAKIKSMGNAGRNGGECYTPRPLIKTIVEVVAPKIGDKIYDGAVGSAGFLCEAFSYLKERGQLSAEGMETLQKRTFFGKEKKILAYMIGMINMILHGVDAPDIVHANTLAENSTDIREEDRYHVILANPPFGGKECGEVQQNFPIQTGETAYLFLQHFINMLRSGGRAGMIIKNTFLSNTDSASVSLRKELLENCNLHTVLDLPRGVFRGTGVRAVVLFFDKGIPTEKIWYYQLDPGRKLGKTNPINEDDLGEFMRLQRNFGESAQSWTVDVSNIDRKNFDLSVRNPHVPEEPPVTHPQEILARIRLLDKETEELLKSMEELI